MITIIVATHNKNKTNEFREMIAGKYVIKDLHDLGFADEIPETGATLEENALLKALFLNGKLGENCLADDTGLEIECLDGAPGVFSARFAGEDKDPAKNIEKVLALMKGCDNRRARFRTVIALIFNGMPYQFEGVVEGRILEEPRGNGGFGYDPVFVADGTDLSFAEMPLEEKNKISHRARAFEGFMRFIEKEAGHE
jgi:XTP/dITP diphosphohydrolase